MKHPVASNLVLLIAACGTVSPPDPKSTTTEPVDPSSVEDTTQVPDVFYPDIPIYGCNIDEDCPDDLDGFEVEWACCDGFCKPLYADEENCGACGVVCSEGGQCCNGRCIDEGAEGAVQTCITAGDEIEAMLEPSLCAHLFTDPEFCGSCEAEGLCETRPNSSPACEFGQCTLDCDEGFADCNQIIEDGCEVSVDEDAENCGSCNNICLMEQCYNGQCDRLAFVTNGIFYGSEIGFGFIPDVLEGLDQRCVEEMELFSGGGLAGYNPNEHMFYAWMSAEGAQSPQDRFLEGGRYVDLNGDVIANSKEELLAGQMQKPIDMTQTGEILDMPFMNECGTTVPVWTGTSSNGIYAGLGDCIEWSSNSPMEMGIAGDATSMSPAWTQSCSLACSNQARIYCFQQ